MFYSTPLGFSKGGMLQHYQMKKGKPLSKGPQPKSGIAPSEADTPPSTSRSSPADARYILNPQPVPAKVPELIWL